MYRQHHHETSPAKVARFLLLNRQFPRAISYCVSEAQLSLHAITGTPIKGCNHESERLLGRLQAHLSYASIEDVMAEGLHEYIDKLQNALNEIGDAIQAGFFGYAPAAPAPSVERGAPAARPEAQTQSSSASTSA
jgi:uncharacterized alpha-E superfamily protein